MTLSNSHNFTNLVPSLSDWAVKGIFDDMDWSAFEAFASLLSILDVLSLEFKSLLGLKWNDNSVINRLGKQWFTHSSGDWLCAIVTVAD